MGAFMRLQQKAYDVIGEDGPVKTATYTRSPCTPAMHLSWGALEGVLSVGTLNTYKLQFGVSCLDNISQPRGPRSAEGLPAAAHVHEG